MLKKIFSGEFSVLVKYYVCQIKYRGTIFESFHYHKIIFISLVTTINLFHFDKAWGLAKKLRYFPGKNRVKFHRFSDISWTNIMSCASLVCQNSLSQAEKQKNKKTEIRLHFKTFQQKLTNFSLLSGQHSAFSSHCKFLKNICICTVRF